MASIQVIMRCRPFTLEDRLGVRMRTISPTEGDVELLNTQYTKNRFAFGYSWWSAYGFNHHVDAEDVAIAESMELVNQDMAYERVGEKIKADVLGGDTVVLFAYGLSGSGKTFTVFGPDAMDTPDAWFKHETPHPLWGIFPHLAYDVFALKQENWKISMKYFQNVVDIVRDLMSHSGEEKSYKTGMQRDKDGFMDITWCESKVLADWDDMRHTFLTANARKAIAPTQFNHQSTRGHCIMTFEVEKPDPDNEGVKQKGRVYVCDLAGTEPAGDIYFADYKKVTFPDGGVEMKLLGPHGDAKKTQELQDQGKKINLSLSEMAQLFMKMAEKYKAGKLKPGTSIPGCNSYFLCKFLKETMLQAKTYLFCAIRPEKTYMNYTYSTLGFATNASVIKLSPKRSMVEASPREMKLMQELAAMKELVASLQAATGSGGDNAEIEEVKAMLKQKQMEMMDVMAHGGPGEHISEEQMRAKAKAAEMEEQRNNYAARGISLTYYEENTTFPYLVNLDEDNFRSERFMYLLNKPSITFGNGGDIRPTTLSVVKNHCSITVEGETVTLVGGKGKVFVNGKVIKEGATCPLKPFDWVAMGAEMMMFHYPGKDPATGRPSVDEVITEYQEALQESDGSAGSLAVADVMDADGSSQALSSMGMSPAMRKQLELTLSDLLVKTRNLMDILYIMDREQVVLDVTLARTGLTGASNQVVAKIRATNTLTQEEMLLDEYEFVQALTILNDEHFRLRSTIAEGDGATYTLPEAHEPIMLLFDNSFHLGTAVIYPEFLIYNLASGDGDGSESVSEIYSHVSWGGTGSRSGGKLEVVWQPLANEEDNGSGQVEEILDEVELLGKPWTYRLSVKGAKALPLQCASFYCEYEFYGTLYTTETVEFEKGTSGPSMDWSVVHHIPSVDKDFIKFLKEPLEVKIYVSPLIKVPTNVVSTDNPTVKNRIIGDAAMSAVRGGAGLSAGVSSSRPVHHDGASDEVIAQLQHLQDENAQLKRLCARLRTEKKVAIVAAKIRSGKEQFGAGGVVIGGSDDPDGLAARQKKGDESSWFCTVQ